MGGGGSGVSWAAPGLSATGRGISGQTLGEPTRWAYVTIRRRIAGDGVGEGGPGSLTRQSSPLPRALRKIYWGCSRGVSIVITIASTI